MIVIPMAGLSSRFSKAGYKKPKYMLEAFNKSLFEHSVLSFKSFFETELFLFIALDVEGIKDFLNSKIAILGIKRFKIVILDKPTLGQSDTVFQGIKKANTSPEESLLIFNIDTFRPNYKFPTEFNLKEIDGYLETFIGSGSNWSNIVPLEGNKVKLTAEKENLSEYCCTGLYYFSYTKDFLNVFLDYKKTFQKNELYIAPMYNQLISQGKDIRFSVIDSDEVVFCGVPSEYESFLKNGYKLS